MICIITGKPFVLNRTEMVPRGPSFGIGSAHAQNAHTNRKNAHPTRDRACIARRTARELAL